MTSPAAAAAGGLKAPNSAPTTACWARSCRARQATGSQAAVTEASSLPVRMTWQRWHSMRSATPRPPPLVSVLTPVARTAVYLFSRTPWSHSTALGCGALLDRCRVRRTEAAAAAVAAFGRKGGPQFQLVGVSR